MMLHDQTDQAGGKANVTQEEGRFLAEDSDELSKTTQQAKWIHLVSQHEDHPGQTLATREHAVIQHWAAERQAEPATVPGTEHGDHLGVLRFDFPGYGGQDLKRVSWEECSRPLTSGSCCFFTKSISGTEQLATSSIWIAQSGSTTKHVKSTE